MIDATCVPHYWNLRWQ